MPKTENKGASVGSISAFDMSGGVQNKTTGVLAGNNVLLHLLNANLDVKAGALYGRSGYTKKYNGDFSVSNLFVHRDGDTRKYIVIKNNGTNQVVYLAPNSDFSGTHTIGLSGHFTPGLNIEMATFGKKTMFFNGVNAPKQYDGTSFTDITNAPATGEFPAVFNQRLFVFGNDSFLHYSDVIDSSGDGFSSDTWTNRGINPNDGQKPMAMKRHRGRLILFKTDSIYRYDGSNEPEPIINVGIQSEKGLWQNDSHLFFHSRTTIRQMSLGDPQIISRPVEKYLKAMSPDFWDNVSMGGDESQMYCHIGTITINDPTEWDFGRTYTNVVLVYNFLIERWTMYSNIDARCFFQDTDNNKQYFANLGGDIMYMDPTVYSDDGKSIHFDVKWHPIHYGVPFKRKTVDDIYIASSPGVVLRAGESFKNLQHFAKYEDSYKGARIQGDVSFNELCVGASEMYKTAPPRIEQLYIGNGYVRS